MFKCMNSSYKAGTWKRDAKYGAVSEAPVNPLDRW